jgi:hypothetical protein
MFSRLTRSARIRFGWLIAAVYLACVLAPGAALALGSGPAPCLEAFQLTDPLQPVAAEPGQDDADAMMAMHDHAGMHMHHQGGAENLSENPPAKHHHDGKTSPGPCCAMLCVSALLADLPTFLKPQQPVSIALSETDRIMTGKAPPLPYRPPIA